MFTALNRPQAPNRIFVGPNAAGKNEKKVEPLAEHIARAKARWLKRVFYESSASSSEKCFAYVIADHLNCVTLDCWPSQARVAKLLGFKSDKTVQRTARGLEELGLLVIKRLGRQGCRYAPVLVPSDLDKSNPVTRQNNSLTADSSVQESLLVIHLNQSSSSQAAAKQGKGSTRSRYQPGQRGLMELKVAELLGQNGFEVLGRLGAIDDRIVERLCRAYATGALTERELIAARLAAEQAK